MKHFSLNQAYIVSFVLLAMWAIFAYATMHSQIKAQQQYAKLINISGKQRMLSQRTALLASQFIQTGDSDYLDSLERFSSLMADDHNYLLEHIPSEELHQIYYQEPYLLDAKAAGYFSLLREFIADSDRFSSVDIYQQATLLLPNLDHAVKVYEDESDQQTARLMMVEGCILVGTLLTLVLEALLILRPTLRKANMNMAMLTEMVDLKTKEINGQKERQSQLITDLESEINARQKAENEQLELERQLRQKYKMEALGTLAGGISHNFNNSLALVLGCLDLALTKHPEEQVTQLLEQARIGVFRSRDLVKQLLAYSRQEETEEEAVRLNEVIKETVIMLKNTIPSSVVLESEQCDTSENVVIRGNSVQIQECLLNLCTNAVYAMEEKGTLTIKLDFAHLEQSEIPGQYQVEPGLFACLSVKDTGCGIDNSTQERVFDLFFTTKEVNQGTGMGLATVQSIVRQHGGLIKLASRPGDGATFELYFPVSQEKINAVYADQTTPFDLLKGTESVMLVDDDEHLALLQETMLSELGYKVTVFLDSTLALAEFARNPDRYQLLVTDQTMPALTGRQLIREIRKIRPDFPTILSTGYSSRINKEQAYAEGINAFLDKPVEIFKLAQVLRSCLDSSQDGQKQA